MDKLSFIAKNDALVMLQSADHYDADCALLAKVNPQSKLQNEIAKANEFNRNSLHGRILMELLDLVPIGEIQAARHGKKPRVEKPEEPKNEPPAVKETEPEKPKVNKPKAKKATAEKPEVKPEEKKKGPKV
jgi:outer membrane biosynthesis protein TonB